MLYRLGLTLRAPRPQAKAVAPVASLRESAGKAAAAAVIGLAVALGNVPDAMAKDVQPYAGLTPCKSNAAFAKREKAELKTLTKRLKNVRAPV